MPKAKNDVLMVSLLITPPMLVVEIVEIVIAADPGTDIDVGTAGGLLPDVADFDPTSAPGVMVMRLE